MVVVAPAVLDHIARDLACRARLDHLPAGPGRRWIRIVETDGYDAWLIAWPSGTGLAMHDHGGSGAVVRVVEGTLVERYRDGAPQDVRTRVLRAGDGITFGPEHVHAITNEAAAEALTVHVYSPRLRQMSYFD